MSEVIRIRDKEFKVSIPEAVIRKRIAELGASMNADLAGQFPLFVSVLNGAFLFTADLLRHIVVDCEVTFVRVASYNGTQSSGEVRHVLGLGQSVKGRHVVLVEDIIDTGHTAVYLLEEIRKQQPASVRLASLLLKPDALQHPLQPDYVGFEVANDFLVGYGLDYDGLGRNLNDIYKII